MIKDEDRWLLDARYRYPDTLESIKVAGMFKKAVSEGFSYDEISNYPDCPVYASAELLVIILPLLIDEMFARNDFENYLIYPMTTAVDPSPLGGKYPNLAKRTEELAKIVDKDTADKIRKFLSVLKPDPPILPEEFDKIYQFWEKLHI